MLWLWVRDWILWVANFQFPFYEISVQTQWGAYNFEIQLRARTLVVQFQLLLGWNKHLFVSTDIVNLVLKTDEGEPESIDFCSLAVLKASVDKEW